MRRGADAEPRRRRGFPAAHPDGGMHVADLDLDRAGARRQARHRLKLRHLLVLRLRRFPRQVLLRLQRKMVA